MDILIQYASDTPQDYVRMPADNWRSILKARRPSGPPATPRPIPRIEDGRLVNAINVQGNIFMGDWHVVEQLASGAVRVTTVNDDPKDWSPDEYIARVVTIRPLAPDARFGGAYNTASEQLVYTDSAAFVDNPIQNTIVRPWSEFTPPAEELRMHGAWLSDEVFAAHGTARRIAGWREWTDGVPPQLVGADKRVKSQRRRGLYSIPDGTRTYYETPTVQNNPVHSGGSNPQFEQTLALQPTGSGAVLQTASGVGLNGSICWSAITVAGEPGTGTWPLGIYRCQIDVTQADISLAFGLLDQGNVVGHFARLGNILILPTEVDTHQQIEPAFALAGLKLATTGPISWAGSNADDVLEVLIAAARLSGHGGTVWTREINELDDFVDGPWPEAAASTDDALFFGPGA